MNLYDPFQSHTGLYLKKKLKEVLAFFNLDNRDDIVIVAITTDSAGNMRCAVDLMGYPKLPCIAHKNHTLITKALAKSQAEELIAVVKAIVEYFNRYTVASYRLSVQRQKINAAAIKLCQGVATRWNSDYEMLVRFLDMESTLRPLIDDLPKCPIMPTKKEIDTLKTIAEILKDFNDFTVEASSNSKVTLSLVIPFTHALKSILKERVREFGKSKSKKLLAELAVRLSDQAALIYDPLSQYDFYGLATLLDPRFKDTFFNDVEKQRHMDFAEEWLNKIKYSNTPQEQPDAEGEQVTSTAPLSENNLWRNLRLHRPVQETRAPKEKSSRELLEDYIKSPILDRGANPLEYWSANKLNQPELFQLARRILVIPASSVASERAGSVLKSYVGQRKGSIDDDYLTQRLFLKTAPRVLAVEAIEKAFVSVPFSERLRFRPSLDSVSEEEEDDADSVY